MIAAVTRRAAKSGVAPEDMVKFSNSGHSENGKR
jgi:hypothetical protein